MCGASIPSAALKVKQKLYSKLVYSKLREALGGRCEYAISGGGALPDREEQDREQHDARDHDEERREPVDVQHDPERDRPAADRDGERLPGRVHRV